MLRVSGDVWERALHASALAEAREPDGDPQEQESVITLSLPPQLADLTAFRVASQEPQQ